MMSNMKGNTGKQDKHPGTQVSVIHGSSHLKHSGEGKAVLTTVGTPGVRLCVQSAGLGIAPCACVKKKNP